MRQILELLERDAQLSPDTIATMTDLPVEEVRAAIAGWEASGAIRRYRAVIDWDKVDDDPTSEEVTAFIDVSLTPARGVGFDDVAERIARFDEVRSVYLVSGTQDLRATVTGRSIRKVSDFVSQKLSTIDRVRSTTTHFVLRTYKRDGDAFTAVEPDHRLPVTLMRPLNDVISACPPSGIRRFFDIAAEMDDVISLGVGEPDFVTPWRVREAGIYALEHGYTTYTSNAGLPRLRELICGDLAQRYGAEYSWQDECLITTGVSEGLDLALRVLLNPGDEVIVPEPCYVAYEPCVAFAGGTPVRVATRWEDGFAIDAAAVEAAITPRTKAVLIGSPANPTGAVQPKAALEALVRLAEKHDLYLISDEIYDRLTYTGTHTCLGALPGARDRTVVLGGFSKAQAMTGWRVGWICAPQAVAELAVRVHQYTMLCAPHVSQIAAIEALAHADDDVVAMVADYDRRRRVFVKGLRETGLDCPEPEGAFYAFPSIRSSGLDSETFAEKLLAAEHVAVVPGSVFGPSGEGHVRCSYATALPLLEEALVRIDRFLRSL